MAVLQFRGRAAAPVLHGLFAAAGLVVLLLMVLRSGTGGSPALALGLFLLAVAAFPVPGRRRRSLSSQPRRASSRWRWVGGRLVYHFAVGVDARQTPAA